MASQSPPSRTCRAGRSRSRRRSSSPSGWCPCACRPGMAVAPTSPLRRSGLWCTYHTLFSQQRLEMCPANTVCSPRHPCDLQSSPYCSCERARRRLRRSDPGGTENNQARHQSRSGHRKCLAGSLPATPLMRLLDRTYQAGILCTLLPPSHSDTSRHRKVNSDPHEQNG